MWAETIVHLCGCATQSYPVVPEERSPKLIGLRMWHSGSASAALSNSVTSALDSLHNLRHILLAGIVVRCFHHYAHDFHLHCVFALSLVILADQRRSLHFCPVFAARTSAISGIKKRPSSMSLVYCSTGTACCQQNSPKYAEIFYQDRIVHRCPANCNTLFVRGGSGQEMILRAIFPARRTILLFFPLKSLTHPIWNTRFSSGC